jgi:hypothetical protein
VVDAAGAIYVIGGLGTDGTTYYKDVWASTDGGARAGLGQQGVVKGYTRWDTRVGYSSGVLRGTAEY